MRKSLIVVILAVFVAACGADAQFKSAKEAETGGRFYDAWQKYQEFAAKNPEHEKAPEALFQAGWLAQSVLSDCNVSLAFYEQVLNKYPQSDPWSSLAEFHMQNCPDYFPLTPNTKWVEGDSETGGKNARIETVCQASSSKSKIPFSSAKAVRDYYAGGSKFKTVEIEYRKDGATLWEYPEKGEAPRIILKGPIEKGTSWKGKIVGRDFNYEIASTTRTVSVVAGTFENCVQVVIRSAGVPGATNEFYCPSVGRVLTSFSTSDGERRNTELLSYSIGEMSLISK